MKRKIRILFSLIRSKFHKNVMVCFGTSLTAGSGWVKMLGMKLPDWYVVNLANGGMNSNWGVTQIKNVLRFKPKIILMEWAINDAYIGKPYFRPISIHSESYDNLVEMIQAFKGIKIIMLGMNPPLDMFLCGRNPAKDRPDYRIYSMVHKTIAENRNIPYIDITREWDKLSEHQFLFYCPDGLHPNALASRDIIIPKILELLNASNQFNK